MGGQNRPLGNCLDLLGEACDFLTSHFRASNPFSSASHPSSLTYLTNMVSAMSMRTASLLPPSPPTTLARSFSNFPCRHPELDPELDLPEQGPNPRSCHKRER